LAVWTALSLGTHAVVLGVWPVPAPPTREDPTAVEVALITVDAASGTTVSGEEGEGGPPKAKTAPNSAESEERTARPSPPSRQEKKADLPKAKPAPKRTALTLQPKIRKRKPEPPVRLSKPTQPKPKKPPPEPTSVAKKRALPAPKPVAPKVVRKPPKPVPSPPPEPAPSLELEPPPPEPEPNCEYAPRVCAEAEGIPLYAAPPEVPALHAGAEQTDLVTAAESAATGSPTTDSPRAPAAGGTTMAGKKGSQPSGAPDGSAAGSQLVKAAPAYAENPVPAYPRVARRRGLEGEVWLRVRVSETGRVLHVEVHRSSGHRVLDQAAHKAVNRWRFHPALLGDVPVESEVLVPVRFQLQGSA
jgi:protein TonB